MSRETKFNRLWAVDLSRGMLIIFMALGHTIFFMHSGFYDILNLSRSLADLICFTGLIFLSGIAAYYAYLHLSNDPKTVRFNLTKKITAYLLGYYALAITGYILKYGWSWSGILEIIFLRYFFPFTEFIPTFIFFGIIKIPLKHALAKIADSFLLTFILGLVFYCLGVFLYPLPVDPFFEPWKALLVGSFGYYTFPIFFYTPIYLFGIWIGTQVYQHSHSTQQRVFKQQFLLIGLIFLGTLLIGTFASIPLTGLFHRFPPTPTFLLSGLTLVTGLLYLFQRTQNLKYQPFSQNTLLVFGQNAFSVYWAQTLLLFIYQWLHFPSVSSVILILIFFMLTLIFSLYLAKVMPFNYRYGLEVYDIIEDFKVTPQEKTKFHRLTEKLISNLLNLPNLFSFRVGNRRIKIFSGKTVLMSVILLLAMVTQLGVSEEIYINQSIWQNLEGKVNRVWITTKDPKLDFALEIPAALNLDPQEVSISYAIDDQIIAPMAYSTGQFRASVNAKTLPPGKHQLTAHLKTKSAQLVTKPSVFYLSAPLYVAWTVDWEGYDVPNPYLQAMAQIADSYALPISHMFNPAVYSSPGVDPARADYLTAWVKNRLSQGDDFGLHLHMFPHYINLTGVIPKTDPNWGGGFSLGYDVLTTAYSYEEMKQILTYSLKVLEDKGLPTPKTYRAGAWFANLDTLKALEDTGFLADTSGRTKYVFGTNKITGFWDLKPETQPYYPSLLNQNSSSPSPQFKILEIPNNGADDYAFDTKAMLDRFSANFSNEPLITPRQITFLSHPQWLTLNRQKQMKQVFDELNRHSAALGLGPVIFTTLTNIYDVFK